jgi:hypothetical protein
MFTQTDTRKHYIGVRAGTLRILAGCWSIVVADVVPPQKQQSECLFRKSDVALMPPWSALGTRPST